MTIAPITYCAAIHRGSRTHRFMMFNAWSTAMWRRGAIGGWPTAVDLATITGQKPVVTRAKKSIANFKLREGVPIGCMVTLRQERMYEFLDRLIHVALPRVRDFKGVSDRSFDGRGNYSLGLREQIIFPEIQVDKVEKTRGMTVSFITNAKTDEEGRTLLKLLGMPFVS